MSATQTKSPGKGRSKIIDAALRRLVREERRRLRQRIARRKWSAETACMSADDVTAAGRIALAREIEAYVWEGAGDVPEEGRTS